MTRYFRVTHRAGAFIDGIHYPCADELDDISVGIVPLELDKNAKAPLWGIEVDVNGNEIGTQPVPARERLGDVLGNKIAADAGAGAKNASGTPAEAEQRKQTIVETLALLDHANDGDWTTGGLPKVDVVANASGLEGLTRDEITAAQPDFARKTA